MFCSRGFNLTSWILDFVPALVTHAKCESSWRLHYGILSRSKSLSLREHCCPNCLAPLSGCALASERNPECRSAPLRANFLAALTGCVSARRRRDGILARGERAIASHPGFYRSTQNRTPKGVRGDRST